MAMIKCKECKNDVSNTAKTCPSCGANLQKRWKELFIVPLIGVWIYLLSFVYDAKIIEFEIFSYSVVLFICTSISYIILDKYVLEKI